MLLVHTVLDITATDEIELNATLVDVNANLDVSGTVTATGTSVFASLDISGDIDVDGTTNLDVVDIDGAVDMASTLGVAGVVTANAGVVVDEMTLDGDTLTATDTFTIDATADITIDAGGGDIRLKNGGTEYGKLNLSSNNLNIHSTISDQDILFKGNDGGSEITALQLNMSDAGHAVFNGNVTVGGDLDVTGSFDMSDANITNVGSIALD